MVQKTTLYLPEDLKLAIKRAAAERGVSEAEVIREALRVSVGGARPRPRGALYRSGKPIAREAEELLAGFGER
jgi:plasmid stability protein